MTHRTRIVAAVVVFVVLCQSATVGVVVADDTTLTGPAPSASRAVEGVSGDQGDEWNLSRTHKAFNSSSAVQASHDADTTTDADAAILSAIYRVNRTPEHVGSVRVTYELVVPDAVGILTLSLDESYTIQNTTEFEENPDGTWGWTRTESGTKTVTVTYTAPITEDRFGQSTVDTREWAFFGISEIYVPTEYQTAFGVDTTVDIHLQLVPEGQGYGAAGEFIYLGPYSITNHSGPNQSFTYVRAGSADQAVSGSQILERLSEVGQDFDVGAVDEAVTVFVLPSPPLRSGGAAYGTSFWVSDNLDANAETWTHEYVHTRQAYPGTGEDLRWFTEGSADYYAGYFAWKRGQWSDYRFRLFLLSDDTSTILANIQDPSAPAAYQKGRQVIAALDGEIRVATNGQRSFEDVMRQLNARDEDEFAVTLTEFKATVENVSGRDFDAWFERYITGQDAPPVPSLDVYSMEPGTLDAYAGADDVIQTDELQEIIADWAFGELSTSQVQTAIDHWATATPV